MYKICVILIFTVVAFGSYAQGAKDTLAALHQPYQGAMGMLNQAQGTLAQDSVLFAQEWQRLKAGYKRVADSLAQANTTGAGVQFEAQRLINMITFAQQPDSMQHYVQALYHYAAQHQKELVDNGGQLYKIAQCLMGVTNDNLRTELDIAQYNATVVSNFYNYLHTTDWDLPTRQAFFSFFAAQYANMGNMGMAEKFYRHFDTLITEDKPFAKTERFVLPEGLAYTNGLLQPVKRVSYSYGRALIVMRPQQQSLLDLVYNICTLRAYDKAYRAPYDVVLLRDKNTITDDFLQAIKRNLAFESYYVTDYQEAVSQVQAEKLPAYMLVDVAGNVTFQTNNVITFFKELNPPIEAEERANDQLRKQIGIKRDSLAALPVDPTLKYSAEHENSTFLLTGNWEDGLTTRLSPVRWSENDTLPDTTKPYLAQFEVVHPQYLVYKLLVLVNGEAQEITIASDGLHQKSVRYGKTKNAAFYEAIQAIDSTLSLAASYSSIIAQYPFQQSPFITSIKQKQAEVLAYKKQIAERIKQRKLRALLAKYAETKKEALIQIF